MKIWRRREPRPKKKRRRALWVLVFSVIGLGIGAYVVLASPALYPKEITIFGNAKLATAVIREAIPQKSLLLLREGVSKSLESKFPAIRTVTLTRDFIARRLSVAIEEREGIGTYCRFSTSSGSTNYSSSEAERSREVCAVIDRDGVIFEEALTSEGGLILLFRDFQAGDLSLGRNVMEPRLVQELKKMKDEALSSFGTVIRTFLLNQERPGEVTAETAEGWLMYLDPKQSAQETAEILRKVLAEQIKENRSRLEYVDLRIENRVYYKLR